MAWFVLMQMFSTLLEVIWLRGKAEQAKDLEILLLRRQLEIVNRTRRKPVRVSRAEKLTITVLTARRKTITGWPTKHFGRVLRIFQPETVFKWHRELVKRKWTYERQRPGGRPRTGRELERLIVRLARENHDWGAHRGMGRSD